MGNAWLRSNSSKNEASRSQEERRRRLEAQYGVLIPPSFACPSPFRDDTNSHCNNVNDTMPLCSQALLKVNGCATVAPSIIDYLWITHSGRRLLQEYMSRGIWLSAGGQYLSLDDTTSSSSPSSHRSIFVALDTTRNETTSSSSTMNHPDTRTSSPSFLWVGQRDIPLNMPKDSSVSFHVHAPTQGYPSLHVSYSPISQFQVDSHFNATDVGGGGWVGAKFHSNSQRKFKEREENDDDDRVKLLVGSWIPFSSKRQSSTTNKNYNMKALLPSKIHAYEVAEYKESLLAMEATLPLDTIMSSSSYGRSSSSPPILRSTMLTLNLNDTNQNNNTTSSSPPLWLTMIQRQEQNGANTDSEFIMNVNQIITFDRHVVNMMEDRAPNVRQSLGWIVQLSTKKSSIHQQNTFSTTSTTTYDTNLSMGVTWQWNRAIAMKAIVHQNTGTLDYGIICKRWEYPRMTLSLINRFQLFGNNLQPHGGLQSRHSFVGFGIELETTPSQTSSKNNDDYDDKQRYNTATPSPRNSAPPTRVRLP